MHHTLSEINYSLTLVNTSEERYSGEKVSEVITSRSSNGLIIHGSAINKEIANLILDAGFPYITTDPGFESGLCWVDTNHALAGEYAAAHMVDCGYTDVAFIGERKTDYISAQRQKGFMAGMLDRGYHIPASHIGYTDSSRQQALSITSDMLSHSTPPQAIVCENNTLALGVVQAISRHNLRIPDDIAALTFDVYPYSSIIDPQLTIVDINVYDMGVQAGSMMIRKLQNPELLIQSYTTLPVIIQAKVQDLLTKK
ncbi:MAG: substrate-binding domain-containing protein [Lachnospiraceae bacterium]